MGSIELDRAVGADAAAVTELVVALETVFYGHSRFSQADLDDVWSDVDLAHDTRVVRDGERVIGYGKVRAEGDLSVAEGYVHPDALGRGIGRLMASGLEDDAVRDGVRRIHNAVMEPDVAAGRLLDSLGYRAVRVFREMRIELDAPPPPPRWPDGLRVVAFDPDRDAVRFHAAHEEAFADHWEHPPCDFADWSKQHLGSVRFDPTLWCVAWDGEEIAGGTICAGDAYGGGWVEALFTRRRWRGRGVGAALLGDAFLRLWECGERSVGLGVDAASETGAFRLYERAGMRPVLGWVVYEKTLGDAA